MWKYLKKNKNLKSEFKIAYDTLCKFIEISYEATPFSFYSEILNNYRETLYQWLLANKDLFCEHYSHPGQPILPNMPFSEVELS